MSLRVEFELPFRIRSEANARGHWAKKARRAKPQRVGACLVALQHVGPFKKHAGGIRITLTRHYTGRARAMDVGDNLSSGFKAIRDGIAEALGIDDGSSRLTFVYGQIRSTKTGVAVAIEATE